MSFDSARGFCESIGTRLFEPSYSVEDAAVRTEIFANGDQMPTWLGFMDALNEGVFRSNSSGEKVGYTNWASAQPDNNGTDGEHCVIENNDGSWSDVECEAVEAVAVCAEDPVASDCNADLPAGDPDWGDWYEIEGRCFYIGNKTQRASFEEAVTLCKSFGARLFEPRNLEANVAIIDAVREYSRPPFWIGMVFTPEDPTIYRYMSNGQTPLFTNWEDDQPDNNKGNEYCVQIGEYGQDGDGQWSDNRCDSQWRVVCERVTSANQFYDSSYSTSSSDIAKASLQAYFYSTFVQAIDLQIATSQTASSDGVPRYGLSIGPSVNGTPSDQLLVLDLKKQGMDCISSSPLPVPISLRGHLHPYLGRFLACSSGNFGCWLYSTHSSDWEKMSLPSAFSEDITVIGASLNIPDKGIYFFASNNTDNSSTGFLLQFSDGTAVPLVSFSQIRSGACFLYIGDGKMAMIGGEGEETAIDVFDFATESEERLSVTLSTERVNGGCGVIENGGHVLIVGGSDGSTEIWDTQDNKIEYVNGTTEITYPTLVPYGETVLMTNTMETLNEILIYNVNNMEWEETGDMLSDSWKNFIHNGMVTISQTSAKTSESFQQLSCF